MVLLLSPLLTHLSPLPALFCPDLFCSVLSCLFLSIAFLNSKHFLLLSLFFYLTFLRAHTHTHTHMHTCTHTHEHTTTGLRRGRHLPLPRRTPPGPHWALKGTVLTLITNTTLIMSLFSFLFFFFSFNHFPLLFTHY